MIRIRDPIHGSISVTPDELAVIDHPIYQRLRGIKQLGFTDQAFPGATHTRYAHGLGAMEVATRMFDAVFPLERERLSPPIRSRLRQAVRLALLLHDLGHPPASHASESAMPLRRDLAMAGFTDEEQTETASHEDFTLKLLLDSALCALIDERFSATGVDARTVAHLICGRCPDRKDRFVLDGVDYFPLLTQMVSGEMDADRMDYLQRDSFFAGVSYGKFDQPWLLENLLFEVVDDRAQMAISSRAVFAFEDFLLSRYHMFVSVYYHYIPVGFDSMLARFFRESPEDFRLPTDAEEYALTDDVTLWGALRRSKNRWARRIASRQAYRRVIEVNAEPGMPDIEGLASLLESAGLDHFVSRDRGILSKYYRHASSRPIYVVDASMRRVRPIEEYSRIYERYAQPTPLVRIYVHPDHFLKARGLVREATADAAD